MEHNVKSHVQPEYIEKQKKHKSPVQSQKTATPDPANLTRNDLRHMSPADIVRLSGIIGNRAVARLMTQRQEEEEELIQASPRQVEEEEEEVLASPAQRQEEDELDLPGPRSFRQDEDELDLPGPRTKPPREYSAPQRSSTGLRSASPQRAAPHSSATGNIGDAVDLDGEALYGWDRTISWRDVSNVVNGVIPTMSSEEGMPRIVIFSGTHGNRRGHLVNNATSRGFVAEDQATANAVMRANPGVEVEVIDVVNSYTTKDQLTRVYGMTDYIRILGWCYSQRSYNLGDAIKSNWWAAPDNL